MCIRYLTRTRMRLEGCGMQRQRRSPRETPWNHGSRKYYVYISIKSQCGVLCCFRLIDYKIKLRFRVYSELPVYYLTAPSRTDPPYTHLFRWFSPLFCGLFCHCHRWCVPCLVRRGRRRVLLVYLINYLCQKSLPKRPRPECRCRETK